MKKVQFAKYISRNTLIRSIAALSILGMAWMTASAQLTLDNFPNGNSGKDYVKTITTTGTATHYEGLPSGSLLGAARETIFTVGTNPYSQTSTIDVGNGILIVDTGFQAASALTVGYGFSVHGKEVPLGLDLSSYTGLQLNFAGSSSLFNLDVLVEIWPSSGGYYTSGQILTPSYYPYSVSFPYTSFLDASGAALTPTEAGDINYIIIEFYAGYAQSYGITSLQAYN